MKCEGITQLITPQDVGGSEGILEPKSNSSEVLGGKNCRGSWRRNITNLGGSHRSSSIASDLTSRALTSQALWLAISPTDPQTPENSKTQKSGSKVSFGLPAKVTQKLLKSDSKVTFSTVLVTFEPLSSHFWVTLAGSPKVTFEPLFHVFEFSGVWGSVWGNGESQRRPNCSGSPNRRHFVSLDLRKHADFSHRRPTSQDFRESFCSCEFR